MQSGVIIESRRLAAIVLLLTLFSPMAHAATSWSPASFTMSETWNDYLTNDLNSGSVSSTLSTSGGNDRSMGLYLTGGVVDGLGQYLLTHASGSTLAMSSLLFSSAGGSFDIPTDGGPWTGLIAPDNGNPSVNTISVSFTIPQSEAAGKPAGDYTTTINICGKRNGNNANCNGNRAALTTLNITVTIPVINAAIVAFPAASGAGGSDLSVTWDGASTAGFATDTINICVGTDSTSGVDVVVNSANAFQVTDGTTAVAYSLTLNGDDVTDGVAFISAATATDLLCTVSDIPLELGFANATLATTPTDGVTPFLDQVTITVTPQ